MTGYVHLVAVVRQQVLEVFRVIIYFVLGIELHFAHRPVPDAGQIPQRNALRTNLLSPAIRSARFSLHRRCWIQLGRPRIDRIQTVTYLAWRAVRFFEPLREIHGLDLTLATNIRDRPLNGVEPRGDSGSLFVVAGATAA